MRIAAYVVIDPPDKDSVLREMLQAIAESRLAKLMLRSVDVNPCEERVVDFGVRQVDVSDFGQKQFIGVFTEDDVHHVINVIVPMWDEETSVKITPTPTQPA